MIYPSSQPSPYPLHQDTETVRGNAFLFQDSHGSKRAGVGL